MHKLVENGPTDLEIIVQEARAAYGFCNDPQAETADDVKDVLSTEEAEGVFDESCVGD